ncbi:MAG: OmpA family protein [Bacteroidota bacterium]
MSTRILLVTFLIIVNTGTSLLYAQPMDNGPLLRKAMIEYQGLRFTSAIKELTKVLDKDPENVAAQEMIAGSNRNIKNYDEALYWYGELCKQKNIKPEWALYYAEALANREKYEESEQWYRKFLSMKPNDRRAEAFSKANLNTFSSNAGEYKVVYSSLNTDASEYSPMYYKNGLIFISNREEKNRYVFQWDRTAYSDMYFINDLEDITEGEPDSAKRAEKLKASRYVASHDEERSLMSLFSSSKVNEDPSKEPQLLRGKVNSSYHEGPAALLPEGSLLFTRNNYIGGKAGKSQAGVNKLKLYTASGPTWEKITNFPYNNNEYSTGHPTVSSDGKVLIFSSDMPRGFGGTDLYYCVRTGDGKQWGRPVNLGPRINTEGHEQFPYLDKNGKLYFSSTGHPGLGGLDIFEVVLKDLKPIGNPKHLGSDVNSSADDFGYIQDEMGKTGYFSSNRRGNDDIYQFTRMAYTVTLKGSVIDANGNRPLPGSKVIMRQNGVTDTLTTNAKGEFTRILKKETDYELGASRLSYVSAQNYISTSDIKIDSTINVVLKLTRAENIQQWVMDNCASLKKTFTLKNIYYDLDKAVIRPDAQSALDEIAEVLRKNPEISIITASHTDSRATESYNRDLSLRRGEAAKAYLVARGISAGRIEVQYYGKSRLQNLCVEGVPCPENEQQANRRTEFEVIMNGVNLSQLNCQN